MHRFTGPCDVDDIKALLDRHMSVSEVRLDRLAPPGRWKYPSFPTETVVPKLFLASQGLV